MMRRAMSPTAHLGRPGRSGEEWELAGSAVMDMDVTLERVDCVTCVGSSEGSGDFLGRDFGEVGGEEREAAPHCMQGCDATGGFGGSRLAAGGGRLGGGADGPGVEGASGF